MSARVDLPFSKAPADESCNVECISTFHNSNKTHLHKIQDDSSFMRFPLFTLQKVYADIYSEAVQEMTSSNIQEKIRIYPV